MLSHECEIIIVGAGVFGLSTALWLARDGYKRITIYDRCSYDKNFYDPSNGCDAPSADINKTFRTTYGYQDHYQALALESRDVWLEWNEAIKESSPSDLPKPLTPGDKLLDICGVFRTGEGRELIDEFVQELEITSRKAPDARMFQFIKGDPEDEEKVKRLGGNWLRKLHCLDHLRDGNMNGYMDVGVGLTVADKANVYAFHLCVKVGVKFVLGEPQGKLKKMNIQESGAERRVTGIQTADGLNHSADLVIVACGPWTSVVVPEAAQNMESAMRMVLMIDIPPHRQDLRDKYSSDVWPVWRVVRGEGEDRYDGGGFPANENGRVKFNFRACKFTNYQDHPTQDSLRLSTPRSKYSENPINTIPLHYLTMMKAIIAEVVPDLAELGISETRLCSSMDSLDTEYVIDYVPDYSDTLFVASGDSGHGYKMLPVLGKYIKNALQRVPDRFTPFWKWRTMQKGVKCNGLEEGEEGPRVISKWVLAAPSDFRFETLVKGIVGRN